MMQELELPEILDIPEKLLPIITEINNYNYFLIEGGRGSAKSHSVARLISWICEQRQVRVVCGRETQGTIEESVYTLFTDLIRDYELNFDVLKSKISHRTTSSSIGFKGFREQGKVNIKGLEGVDILWVDEAEAITKATLDIIIPTIRKQNALVIFTMNRYVRNDAVFELLAGRQDCLHIHIDYFENKHCPDKLKEEAEACKNRNYQDYKHIWLGQPLDQTSEYLFSFDKLDKAKQILSRDQLYNGISAMSVDLSAQGGDLCVATRIESIDTIRFEAVETHDWSEPDTDITIGKIIALYSKWKPDLFIVDADGLGYPIYCTLSKTIKDAIAFHGAGESRQEGAGNQRADGYLNLKDFIDNEWLKINSNNTIKQLEYIKKVYKPNGKIYIQNKKEMKSEGRQSPDHADSLMMGLYALKYYAYLKHSGSNEVSYVNHDFDPYD